VSKESTKMSTMSHSFTDADKFVIKTSGSREVTDKTGVKKTYPGNIYLHFLTKCLKTYDQKFSFAAIVVPDATKEQLHDNWKPILRKKGIRV